MRHKFAFTLTELMIAIAVIGIISALTVPAMVKKYQQDSMVMALKKHYSILNDNLEKYKSEKAIGALPTMNQQDAINFLRDYYKVNEECSITTQCFAAQYRNIRDDESSSNRINTGYGAKLADGASIYIEPSNNQPNAAYQQTCNGTDCYMQTNTYYGTRLATVYLDVNGQDRPNIGGRDMFTFYIYGNYTADSISPTAANKAANRETDFNLFCMGSPIGVGCFGKILNDNWKMNY